MISGIPLISLVIYGGFLGMLFALMATGVTIIFGLMKLVNFAHGEVYMMGGYAFYYATMLLGLNPFLRDTCGFLYRVFHGSGDREAGDPAYLYDQDGQT